MKKRKSPQSAAKGRRPATKKPKGATKKSKLAVRKPEMAAGKPRVLAKRSPDPVELDSRDSFPASDPPSWIPVTGEGTPDRSGRKRRP